MLKSWQGGPPIIPKISGLPFGKASDKISSDFISEMDLVLKISA